MKIKKNELKDYLGIAILAIVGSYLVNGDIAAAAEFLIAVIDALK